MNIVNTFSRMPRKASPICFTDIYSYTALMFLYGSSSKALQHSLKQLCLFAVLLFANIAYAEEPLAKLHIETDGDVIYCSSSPHINIQKLSPLLQDGIPITFTWDISIEEAHDYWLNKDVGSVQFYRQIMPDLVSRQWLLKDSNSGISRATASKQQALSFLSQLQHFAVIDKSLLTSGSTYEIRVRLYIEEGEPSNGWWSRLIKLGKTVSLGRFTMP